MMATAAILAAATNVGDTVRDRRGWIVEMKGSPFGTVGEGKGENFQDKDKMNSISVVSISRPFVYRARVCPAPPIFLPLPPPSPCWKCYCSLVILLSPIPIFTRHAIASRLSINLVSRFNPRSINICLIVVNEAFLQRTLHILHESETQPFALQP